MLIIVNLGEGSTIHVTYVLLSLSRNKTEGTIHLFGENVNSKQLSYKGTCGTGQLTAGFSLG